MDVDAAVHFWVRRGQMAKGTDRRLLAALRRWFPDDWKVDRAVFVTNEQFTQQAELLRRTDLTLKFELVEPGKTGTYLVFGQVGTVVTGGFAVAVHPLAFYGSMRLGQWPSGP